jgi:ankyrin repeat protein
MNVVENTPQFVHRTFAEYLTACWFCKNFEQNRSVLERVLFNSEYAFVKDMLDRMLARGCPLHCAVLDWDAEAVEKLLNEGSDVNAVDKGGRTAMHLIAAEGCDRDTCEEIINSLLRHEARVDAEDLVLKWTALDYAKKREQSFVVERLQSN